MLIALAILAVIFWAAFVPPYVPRAKTRTPTWAELAAEWRRLKDEE